LLEAASDCNTPTYASYTAEIIDAYYLACLVFVNMCPQKLLRLASNCNDVDLFLLNSWDYNHEPLCPARFTFLTDILSTSCVMDFEKLITMSFNI
jgi:hypothetical protein